MRMGEWAWGQFLVSMPGIVAHADLETPSGRKKAVLSAPEPSPVGTGRRKDLNLANPAEGRFFFFQTRSHPLQGSP